MFLVRSQLRGDTLGRLVSATYRFRFFFDAGAGTCLWSGNDATRSRFGYAVNARELEIPAELARRVAALTVDYDASINWDYPPAAGPWNAERRAVFENEAGQTIALLRDALGSDYELIDERSG